MTNPLEQPYGRPGHNVPHERPPPQTDVDTDSVSSNHRSPFYSGDPGAQLLLPLLLADSVVHEDGPGIGRTCPSLTSLGRSAGMEASARAKSVREREQLTSRPSRVTRR